MNKKNIAISEVFVLLVAIISFAYVLGSLNLVSGESLSDLSSAVKTYPPSPQGFIPDPVTDNIPASTSSEKIGTESSGLWGKIKSIFGGGKSEIETEPNKGFFGTILGNALAAGAVYGLVKLVGNLVTDEEANVNAAAAGLGAGTFVGMVLHNQLNFETMNSFLIGGGVAIGVFLLMYKKESTEVIQYQCLPWEAPIGGNDCEKCNNQGILPCSEYQCRSLGQACQLLNKGTKEEKCAWVNRGDVKVPVITQWDDALLKGYRYTPDNTISPPDNGVKIIKTDSTTGCVKAFTPLKFGINVDEPAKCKMDYIRKEKFDDMQFYFGGSSTFKYNHTQTLSLPGPNAINNESPIIQNDGTYSLFVRCMDANGNTNPANFLFKFCVEKGPDTTPPLIVLTSLLNKAPIAYNQTSVPLEVYVNEPSDCKWSRVDQEYDSMENLMSCSKSVFEMNSQNLYKCSTTLTGLKNREDNNFYFRCKDQPLKPENERNKNLESYKFTLIGSQPLIISSLKPNETIKDSTNVIQVKLEAETSAGYKDGEASCYYSNTGNNDDYILFFDTGKTGTNKHIQELSLPTGNYKYYVKCIDLGGNADIKTTEFSVESDSFSPSVIRIYHEENYLKLITNEKAECVYGKESCNYQYNDGIKMQSVNDKEQFTDWNTNFNYYIKCKDEFGNQPLPNQCNIIARPYNILKVM